MKTVVAGKRMFGAVAAAALCWGCGSAASSLPERVAVPFETVCPQADGTPVFIGGYGSAMGYDAADSCLWLLTDRGPNVDGPTPESKVFALPEFAPRVGSSGFRAIRSRRSERCRFGMLPEIFSAACLPPAVTAVRERWGMTLPERWYATACDAVSIPKDSHWRATVRFG